MNSNFRTRTSAAQRARGLALAGSALTALAMFCLKFGEMTRSAWRSVLAPGPATADEALITICGSLALVLTLWLLGALALSLLAAAFGSRTTTVGRASARGARMVAPMILRNAVAALLGVAIIASPAAAQGARQGTSVSARSPITTGGPAHPGSADPALSPAWIPIAGPSKPVPSGTSEPKSGDPEAGPTTSASAATSPIPAATATEATTATATATATTAAGGGQVVPDPGLLPGWLPERPAHPQQPAAAAADPARLAPIASSPRPVQAETDDEVVVRRGDTLWDIAARHLGAQASYGEIALEWPHWFTANRAVIGNDPDQLVPGERLRAPDQDRVGRTSDGKHRPRPLRVAEDGGTR